MPAPRSTVSTAELCALLDVKQPTVSEWVAQGCPHRKRGNRYEFVVAHVSDWRLERAKRGARDETSPDEAVERARKLRADADMAELKLAERRRQIVDVATSVREVERLLGLVRTRVLSLRGRWQPRILGLGTMAEAAAVMDALTDDVLASLRESVEVFDAEPEPGQEVAA